mmetsp:Transcript_28281/g.77626  ORF Transcript_28281/g.77626 Transcript_28281/m.77626 type:complete len:515 (+) Transcript_28281:211-1755(+)
MRWAERRQHAATTSHFLVARCLMFSAVILSCGTVDATVFLYNETGQRAEAYPSLPALFGVPFLSNRFYEGALQYLVENPFLCDIVKWNETSFVDVPPLSALPPEGNSRNRGSGPTGEETVIEPIVLLASRGHCPFHTKAIIAESLGARVEYLIVQNHNLDGEDVFVPMYSEYGSSRLKIMSVTHRTGTALKRYIANASEHTKAAGGPLIAMDAEAPEGVMTAEDLQDVLISTLGLFFMLVSFSGCFLLCAAAAAQANRRNGRGLAAQSPLWMILMGDPDQDPVMVGDPAEQRAAAPSSPFGGPTLLSANEVEYYLIRERNKQHHEKEQQQQETNSPAESASINLQDEPAAASSPTNHSSLGGSLGESDEPSDSQCPICLDDMDESLPMESTLKLPCGHDFHTDCIVPWLTERQSKCPLCKFDVYAHVQEKAEVDPRDDDSEQDGNGGAPSRGSRPRQRRHRFGLFRLFWSAGSSSRRSWTAVEQDQEGGDEGSQAGVVEEFELEMAETSTARVD